MGILIRRALAAAAAFVFSGMVAAQQWPAKTIKIIVPYPPGGTSDILARALAPGITTALGQAVIIENKPGATGNVGADFVAKSPPDGYTVLLADIGSLAISPSVFTTLPFDPVKDFAPVVMVAYSPHLLAVHPSVAAKDAKELIALAKAQPNSLNFAVSGIGGANHLAGIDFAMRAGIQWTYIPYKGGSQAITDVIGGQAQVLFNGMLATYPYVKDGKLTADVDGGHALVPITKDRFQVLDAPIVVMFEGSVNGHPQRMLALEEGAREPDIFEYGLAAFSPSGAQLTEYAGGYYSDELDTRYTVILKDDKLVVRRRKFQDTTLTPKSADEFSTDNVGTIKFTRDAQKRVSGFEINAGRIRHLQFVKQSR